MIPLIIFAKVPLPGFAKTRIAAACGIRTADRIYRELLEATALAVSGFLYHVAFTGDISAGKLGHVFSAAQSFFPQSSGTLGERLDNAFRHMYEVQHAEAAIAIGCDCPYLSQGHFMQAISLLQAGAEVVIAPALDGGYTLIGCRPRALPVFQAQSWGKAELFRETMAIIERHGYSLELLPAFPDIDTLEDYMQWHHK